MKTIHCNALLVIALENTFHFKVLFGRVCLRRKSAAMIKRESWHPSILGDCIRKDFPFTNVCVWRKTAAMILQESRHPSILGDCRAKAVTGCNHPAQKAINHPLQKNHTGQHYRPTESFLWFPQNTNASIIMYYLFHLRENSTHWLRDDGDKCQL